MPTRKGAIRRSDIPPAILRQLNAGTLPAASLAETLAVDFAKLLANVHPKAAQSCQHTLLPTLGITQRMLIAGTALAQHATSLNPFLTHTSDTVRGWAAFAIAANPNLSLQQRLTHIQPLADDPHSGVREWAWLALRPHIAQNLTLALQLLTPFTTHTSPNLRRFASEITRPRGVWCTHLTPLKNNPALGLPILQPLHNDPARYVQLSVGNWLNDAAKSHPHWVRQLCTHWLKASPTPATAHITKRAQRSLPPP